MGVMSRGKAEPVLSEGAQPRAAGVGAIGLRRENVIALAGFALVWELLSLVLPDYVVPGWGLIWESLRKLRLDWVAVTVARVLVALVLSFVAGSVLAVVMYFDRRIEDYVLPLVRLIMAVPVVCWILFAVLWFRGMEVRITFVLAVACAPIFLIDLLDGMKAIPKELRDMVRVLRPTRWDFFRKLVLPGVLPSVLTSWKVNLSQAIRVVTMAELVGATKGIGYGLVVAQELFSVAEVFAWTVVLVLILYASLQLVNVIEERSLQWRE